MKKASNKNSRLFLYLALGAVVLLFSFLMVFRYYYQNNKDKNEQVTNNKNDITSEKKSEPEINKPIPEPSDVPILMYHYIRDYNDPNDTIGTNLSVSISNFANNLDWIESNGYETINFNQLEEYYQKKITFEKKPIVITFDDGYRDAYQSAYPKLKEKKMIAVFYIISDFLDKPEYLSTNELVEMSKNKMIIGSHTRSHPDLSKISTYDQETQISQSQSRLEKIINIKISDFCYPAGKYNNSTIELLKNLNFKSAVTTKNGISTKDSDFFELPRIRMTNSTNLEKTLKTK